MYPRHIYIYTKSVNYKIEIYIQKNASIWALKSPNLYQLAPRPYLKFFLIYILKWLPGGASDAFVVYTIRHLFFSWSWSAIKLICLFCINKWRICSFYLSLGKFLSILCLTRCTYGIGVVLIQSKYCLDIGWLLTVWAGIRRDLKC